MIYKDESGKIYSEDELNELPMDAVIKKSFHVAGKV